LGGLEVGRGMSLRNLLTQKIENKTMNKKEAKQIEVVLNELRTRLPKDSTKGFMPQPDVVVAMEELEQMLNRRQTN
jgi:hypothetical protein